MALERLRERWEQITPRERMLVAVLGSVAVAGIVAISVASIQHRLADLAEKNEQTRAALQRLARYRQNMAEQGPQEVAAKIGSEPIGLDSYLDGIINELKLQSPAYPPRKEAAKGEFTEVTMDIRMPKPLTVFELKDLLERIETRDPKVIVRDLNIRKNFSDKSKLDVTMVVATYYKKAKEKDKKGEDKDKDKSDDKKGNGS